MQLQLKIFSFLALFTVLIKCQPSIANTCIMIFILKRRWCSASYIFSKFYSLCFILNIILNPVPDKLGTFRSKLIFILMLISDKACFKRGRGGFKTPLPSSPNETFPFSGFIIYSETFHKYRIVVYIICS